MPGEFVAERIEPLLYLVERFRIHLHLQNRASGDSESELLLPKFSSFARIEVMRSSFRILLVSVCLLPITAAAQQPQKTVDCYCTDSSGERVELGVTVCLFVDGRSFRARCEMALNNPFWRETGEPCVMSLHSQSDGEFASS